MQLPTTTTRCVFLFGSVAAVLVACGPTKATDSDAGISPTPTEDGGTVSDGGGGGSDANASGDGGNGLPPITPCPTYEANNPKHHAYGQESPTTFIEKDETWVSTDTYFIFSLFEILGATLTIEAGTRVCLTPGLGQPPTISVKGPIGGGAKEGRVIIKGTAENPVIFDRLTKDDLYSGFSFDGPSDAQFDHVRFNGGGVGGFGVIKFGANHGKAGVLRNVHIENFYKTALSVQNPEGLSADSTLYIDSMTAADILTNQTIISASILGSRSLTASTVKVSQTIPLEPRAIRFIDSNVRDDLTLHGDIGADYVATDLIVRKDSSSTVIPTLTVEAGARVRFSQGELTVGFVGSGNEGTLVVNGTAAKPVVFTSVNTPADRGQWNGVTLYPGQLGPATAIHYLKIENAGGGGGANIVNCRATSNIAGALKLRPTIVTQNYAGPPIDNLEVVKSGGDGLAFNCVAAGCLTTDYTTAVKGSDNAGDLVKALGCP